MDEGRFKSNRWDRTREVAIPTTLPAKRVAFTTFPKRPVARIVFDYATFLRAYEQEFDWCSKHAQLKHVSSHRIVTEAIQEEITRVAEVDIGALADRKGVALGHCFHRVLSPAVAEGRIYLYDIENRRYVDSFLIRNHGYQAGPMAGRGGIEYKLPSGKTFLEEFWIS